MYRSSIDLLFILFWDGLGLLGNSLDGLKGFSELSNWNSLTIRLFEDSGFKGGEFKYSWISGGIVYMDLRLLCLLFLLFINELIFTDTEGILLLLSIGCDDRLGILIGGSCGGTGGGGGGGCGWVILRGLIILIGESVSWDVKSVV